MLDVPKPGARGGGVGLGGGFRRALQLSMLQHVANMLHALADSGCIAIDRLTDPWISDLFVFDLY